MKWSPSQPNGWYPKLSPDGKRVLYGFGEVFLAKIGVNEEHLNPGFTYGWLSNTELLYGVDVGGDKYILHEFVIGMGDVIIPTQYAAGNTVDANDGHWVSSLTKPDGRVVLDDKMIDYNGMGVHTAGGKVLYMYNKGNDNYCLKLYEEGVFKEIYPKKPYNVTTLHSQGYIGYGYWGPAYLITPDGIDSEVTITPWKKEGVPVVYNYNGEIWLWCGTIDPYDKLEKVVGHPLGSDQCIVIENPSIGLSVVCINNEWIIAGCTDRGALTVQSVSVNAPRVKLVDRRPPMPAPIIDFSLDRSRVFLNGTVLGSLTQKENCETWRWLVDNNIHKPNDGDTHEFRFDAPGSKAISIRAAGPPVDENHQDYEPETKVYTTPIKMVEVLDVGKPAFYFGVQTGFGQPIGLHRYEDLNARKWNMARIQAVADSYLNQAMIDEVLYYRMEPIVLCKPEFQIYLPKIPLFVEPYNEPNAGCEGGWPKLTPEEYARLVFPMFGGIHQIVIGCINNPDKEAIVWLKKVVALLPHAEYGSYHRYPQNDQDVATKPRHDYRTIDQEFAAVREAFGNRVIFCTEFGWHNSPFKQGWPKSHIRTLSQKETHDRIKDWFNLLRRYGIKGGIDFQIWEDGPRRPEKDFGIYDVDWNPKLAANVPSEMG